MPVSREILEGRWRRLQEGMGEAGLDALVVAGRGVIAGFGSVFYVTGYTPLLRTSFALLRPDGEPVFFVGTHTDEAIVRERGLIADVRSSGEGDYERAEAGMAQAVAAEILGGGRPRRVGVAGLGQIATVADYLTLERELRGADLVDATAVVAAAKARKDEWELEQVRAAFRLAERAYNAAPDLVEPGLRAQDAVAELERILRAGGALEVLVFADSDLHPIRRVTDTVFADGDLVTVVVEVATADGFWVELGGLLALGEPAARARELADACYRALAEIGSLVAPGVPVAEAGAVLDRVADEAGLRLGLGLGHGIGIDHDLPALGRGAAGVFEEGHVVSVHPSFEDHAARVGGMIADAFHVTAGGAEQLSSVHHGLTVLERVA